MNRGFVLDEMFNPAVLITLALVMLPFGIIALSILDTWAAPSSEEAETPMPVGVRVYDSGAVASAEPKGQGRAKVYAADAAQTAARRRSSTQARRR